MKSISPLENVLKKGIYGDYEGKNEDKLTIIKEKKNLTIVQIVKYKNSSYKTKEIKIDGLSLPHHLKTRHKQGKWLLREIFRYRFLKYASRKLAKRRKTGFFIPIFQLLDQDSRKEIQDYLLHEDSYLKKYFNYDVYSSWVQDFFNNKNIKTEEARATQRILMLLSLSLFLDQYE